MSIPEKNTKGADAQTSRSKRKLKIILSFIFILVLLILSFSSLLFLQISKGTGSQSTSNAETTTPTETPADIYLETPPPQALFYDTFKNNALGWSVSNAAGYYRTVEPGKLSLTNANPGTTLIESLPTNTIFDNFKVSVDLTMLNAGGNFGAGIYIRGDSNLNHDYRIDLNSDDTFDIAKEYIDAGNSPQSLLLDRPSKSSALNPPGEHNTITVIMNGSQMELFLNSEKVSAVTDSDYVMGQIALFVRTGVNSSNATVSFSRVEVDKLKSVSELKGLYFV